MSEVSTYTNLQILAYDPTRTTTLRTAFVRDMDRRFNDLTKVIKKAIIDQDCFGLQVIDNAELQEPYYRAFDRPGIAEKIESFMHWLEEQEDLGILELVTAYLISVRMKEPWTNTYIADAYARGVQRARSEMIRQGGSIPTIDASGGIATVLRSPFHIDHMGLAFNQTYEGVKAITSQMNTQISRILAQGLVDGDTSRVLARKLVATINGSGAGELGITDSLGRFIPAKRRAQMLARTEVVRAHHLANIQEYKHWQVSGVTVVAEWSTAGDDRVCTECAGMHGNRYTLKEIEHMIPRHPNCRCIALPIVEKKK